MTDLVLDASSACLHIIVLRDGALHMEETWFLEHRATEVLADALHRIAETLGITPADFRRIACVNGPGSFTGIRLVLATAAGLKRCGNAVLGAINGLQALALTAAHTLCTASSARIHVVTHARRNLVHHQVFLGPHCEPEEAIALKSPEDVASIVESGDLVCGNGCARNADLFAPLMQRGVLLCSGLTEPTSEALADLAGRIAYSRQDLEPLYVRPCDALANLERLSGRQGIAPDEAHRRYDELLSADPARALL
ncbi:MAG: tRNA (adenosine(37)-N6)-threonylcarbamoyltransferase complex dimerization subunit type 1 TsaB [Desulfovibrionaceae bacterium]|nr:tRNA (adenosine(37)-N6)-threonylcarbamoyltransferase complex dimerization subunit type 1 TsaB [Desulfovibrionaceae bacterium]